MTYINRYFFLSFFFLSLSLFLSFFQLETHSKAIFLFTAIRRKRTDECVFMLLSWNWAWRKVVNVKILMCRTIQFVFSFVLFFFFKWAKMKYCSFRFPWFLWKRPPHSQRRDGGPRSSSSISEFLSERGLEERTTRGICAASAVMRALYRSVVADRGAKALYLSISLFPDPHLRSWSAGRHWKGVYAQP